MKYTPYGGVGGSRGGPGPGLVGGGTAGPGKCTVVSGAHSAPRVRATARGAGPCVLKIDHPVAKNRI